MSALMKASAHLAVAALMALAGESNAQPLAERIASARSGAVVFQFAPRRGLCGDGERFIRLGRSYMGSFSGEMRSEVCYVGPVQVRLTLRDGGVEGVETWAGRVRARDGLNLGAVSATEAARYMMTVA